MPNLTVIFNGATREIPYSPGSPASVCEILEATGLHVRTGCRGDGACGLCLVQVIAGNVNGPTKNERLTLSAEQLGRKVRLACQLIPEGDLSIRILWTTPAPGWRDLENNQYGPAQLDPAAGAGPGKNAYGLAVDLGTTHISLSLWDVGSGCRLSGRMGANPQASYGTDVVTRLTVAGQSPENARRLSRMVFETVHEALREMCATNSIDPATIGRATFVGNTPMLALLTETDPGRLLEPRSWTRQMSCRLEDPGAAAEILGIAADATIDIAAPLAGFVGSDLLAGVVATRLLDSPGGLLIDFGTNSEMALWDGGTLHVTSAAGGPAFESCQSQCRMSAGPGAILRVEAGRDPADLQFRVIGGVEAKGLCGSGLVDLIAILRSRGELTPTGAFTGPHPGDSYVVQAKNPLIVLTRRDVDMFQRAKAAIGVGINSLLAGAGMSTGDLSRVCVCGAFGRDLDVRNAQAIGLLPAIPPGRVELCGNAALAGCERLLLAPEGAKILEPLRDLAKVINLAMWPDFETSFVECLHLRPLEVNQP